MGYMKRRFKYGVRAARTHATLGHAIFTRSRVRYIVPGALGSMAASASTHAEAFEASLHALPHVPFQAVIVTDHEGVVLLHAGEIADGSLQRMAATYAQSSEHVATKLRMGKNRTITAEFGVRAPAAQAKPARASQCAHPRATITLTITLTPLSQRMPLLSMRAARRSC